MIPISNELREAVINEVMPKRLTISQDNSALELFNWFENGYSAGWGNVTIHAPSDTTWLSFASDTVNGYFGTAKYTYFLFEIKPVDITDQTVGVALDFYFTKGNAQISRSVQTTYTNDSQTHRLGICVESDFAYDIKRADYVDIAFSNVSEDFECSLGGVQIFLSDNFYENFDDIPQRGILATKENLNKYLDYSMPFFNGMSELEKFNWYKQEMSSVTDSINIAVNSDTNFNNFSRFGTPLATDLNYDYLGNKKYVAFSFMCKLDNLTSGDKIAFRFSYHRSNDASESFRLWTCSPMDVSKFTAEGGGEVWAQLPYEDANGKFEYFFEFWVLNRGTETLAATITLSKPQVRYYDVTPKVLPYSGLYANANNVEDHLLYDDSNYISNENLVSQTFVFKESICSAENFKLGGCESSSIEIDAFDIPLDLVGSKIKFDYQFSDVEETFKWGNYKVVEAKKSTRGNLTVRHIVAYNDMQKLDVNAYSWYTQYMWGINTVREETYAPYCFDYPRQIFSTYWNLAKSFGVEDEGNLAKQDYGYHSYTGAELTLTRRMVYVDETVNDKELWFLGGNFSKSYFGDNDAFMVVVDLDANRKSGTEYANFLDKYDSIGRGVESANVLLEFEIAGETDTVNYLCDSGDVILPPDNWTSVNIFGTSHLSIIGGGETMANGFYLYGVKFNYLNVLDLINGKEHLPYYSFVWRKPTVENIFKADSSITARDVMRSLMEMCGCFFRLDREGHPQFLYAMEHGLYPSNTLFPADDLFPKKSSEMTMPTSYYIKADFEEYRVSNFGGVQVVVNDFNNNGTVCRWEYWGDDSSDNAYLIDDNIFLCSSQFEYEPEMAGNIETLLENLYGVLNNMSYTPFTAECIGTPFLESGDRFTLLTKSDGFESFIFERTLKGIQAIKDTYEARGKNTPRVKTFEWKES